MINENWQVDYTVKTDELENEYVFIYLKKEEKNLENYSYEYLSLEHTHGNFQDNFLIYDKIPNSYSFEFSSYLIFGYIDIRKYFKPNYDFSHAIQHYKISFKT